MLFHQPGTLTPTPPSIPILTIFCGQQKPYLSRRNVSTASFHNTCLLFCMTLGKLRQLSTECFAVQLPSCVSDSLQPHGLQLARLPCPSLSPWVCSNSCLLSQWCHSTISSSVAPSALSLSQYQALFQWVGSSHQMAKVLELQHQSFQWVFRINFF